MRLLDLYEEELLEAARRLGNEPARRERARRTLGHAGRGLAWVPAVVVVGLAVAISALVMTGGREREQAHPARLVGWYASPVGSGQPLPKGAPQGSTLRLERGGRYRLTTDLYRVIERRDSVTFRLIRDACRPRARVLSRAVWHRAGR